jgi:hypothetical protein
MNLRLILPASAAILLATSCQPYVEPPPPAPADPGARRSTPEEQAKIDKQREEKKKREDGLNNSPEGDKKPENGAEGMGDKVPPTTGGGETKPAPKKEEVEVARPVPGKPGFVFSPFNNKIIDVKGFPPGTLVADPTYPASEKKRFRVP